MFRIPNFEENKIERSKYYLKALGSRNLSLRGQNIKKMKLEGFKSTLGGCNPTPACWH